MPCQNGGTCISVESKGYRCLCSTQYIGSHCEMLKEDTMSTNVTDVESESSGEIDDLTTITTIETDSPGDDTCGHFCIVCMHDLNPLPSIRNCLKKQKSM